MLLHGCFSRILNCTIGTKSRNVSQIIKGKLLKISRYWILFQCVLIFWSALTFEGFLLVMDPIRGVILLLLQKTLSRSCNLELGGIYLFVLVSFNALLSSILFVTWSFNHLINIKGIVFFFIIYIISHQNNHSKLRL